MVRHLQLLIYETRNNVCYFVWVDIHLIGAAKNGYERYLQTSPYDDEGYSKI